MSSSAPERLNVACAVEGEDYVRHSAAMLHSLLLLHPDAKTRIHYLHGEDTSAEGRSQLAAMVRELGGEIVFHAIPEVWLEGLPVKGFTGKATWYRLFLPQILTAERVLYLDTDLLVLDSLLPLWNTDLDGRLVGAVTNVMMPGDASRARWLGMKSAYFNAGVLLMDLEQMRRQDMTERLVACGRHDSERRLGWRDQDVLNVVLHQRRLALHPRWNCMNAIVNYPWATEYFSAEAVEEATSNPAIRHFEGPAQCKPWHALCNPEHRRLYAEHRSHTPWPHVTLAGADTTWGETPEAEQGSVGSSSPTVGAAVSLARLRRHPLVLRVQVAILRRVLRVWAPTGGGLIGRMFLNDLIARTGNFGGVRWLGVPIWQNVLDLWTIQETIAELRPALVIETGTSRGGSALFYAHLLDRLGEGRVITIDIERRHDLDHPRIQFLHGSSTDPAVVDQVWTAARAAEGPVMVILDGDHSRAHVSSELEIYSALVTPGSFLLSQDGVIDQLAIFTDSRPGPLGANRDFLARHPEFEHDRERNSRFIITHHPSGWLRRRK